MAYGKKTSKTTGKPMNRAKRARQNFKGKTNGFKGDGVKTVISNFVDTAGVSIAETSYKTDGVLGNAAEVAPDGDILLSAVLPLDSDAPIWSAPRHASLKLMYNEWNSQACYLDLLFSKELRENADQVFMLVELGNPLKIESENRFCSDVNTRMYNLGNNTQKISYKYVYNTAQSKINHKCVGRTIAPTEIAYLKILIKGKNVNNGGGTVAGVDTRSIAIGQASMKIRSKFYNIYSDMKVLTSNGLQDNAADILSGEKFLSSHLN